MAENIRKITCDHCDHEWDVDYTPTCEDVQPLECPRCGKTTWVTEPDIRPIHLVVSSMHGNTYFKPNRPCPAYKLHRMLMDAIRMLENGPGQYGVVTPEECPLQVFLTVDEGGSEERAKEFLE